MSTCHTENPLNARNCECGDEFPQPKVHYKTCEECGALNPIHNKTCQSCGSSFENKFNITLTACRDG